jgi:hypothetical protein
MSLVSAVLLIAATATGPALEASPPPVAAPAAVSAAFRTPTPPSTITVPAATAERTLKTRTWIAATHSDGLARKFAERFRSLSGNPRTCFARQQNYTIVHEGRCLFVCMLPGFVRVHFGFLMVLV